MRRLLLLWWLGVPAAAQAQILAPVQEPGSFSSTAPDAEKIRALLSGLTPTPYTVMKAYPHDPRAFTEGLLWRDGYLYEGTGLKGESVVRQVDLNTGAVRRSAASPDEVFAEGMTLVGDTLVQLTYKEGRAFVYDADTFELLGEHRYRGEGWGLAFDGKRLIMSDGSCTLTFRDPATFQSQGSVQVMVDGKPLAALNELEYIDGRVWANVWFTNYIVMIDPVSGRVTGYLDLTGIQGPGARAADENDVLNGIAYDPGSGRLFVTGKRWSSVFELKVGK
ncbi:MAG: glutaminyl-peptide cyclotransferase [Elusimicrobiota bacterium]|jgi:glutamine cyclotransferase